jgi:5-methylcytosine-specific restriction endonuclease McrA
LKRSELKRKTPLKPGKVKLRRKPLRTPKQAMLGKREPIPKQVRKRVMARDRGLCVACRRRKAEDIHHVLPVRQWPELTTVEANMVGCCRPCHANHEAAFARIPLDRLPRETFKLAQGIGAGWYIDRNYPEAA